MENWSPQDAMEAYLLTLHLINKLQYCNKDDKPRVIEPKCMELISALAAGKGAKIIVEITTKGITPLTIALGVAAKQSGGQLISILASESDEYSNSMKTKLGESRDVETANLGDVIKLVHAGKRACEMIMQLKNIDFAVLIASLMKTT